MSTRKSNSLQFIEKSQAIHGDTYDYSESVYVNSNTPLVIKCRIHGSFLQKPSKHLSGQGCRLCGSNRTADKLRGSAELFISKCNLLYGNKYDYSRVVYVNNVTHVDIICPIHGVFQHTPGNHLNGSGCRMCRHSHIAQIRADSQDDFILKAIAAHGDRYDYSQTEYYRSQKHVSILCKDHGVFQQMPYCHIAGQGCPKCSTSNSSQETFIADYITSLGYTVVVRHRPAFLKGRELDIYIPDKKLAIEYCGSVFHHSSTGICLTDFLRSTSKEKYYHYNKWKDCRDNGIRLITIYDFKWFENKDKYLQLIRHCLGLSKKIYARKCTIEEIDNSLAYSFHKENHIESFYIPYKNSRSYGLFFDGVLLMASTVGEIYDQQSRSFKLKLQRISTLSGHVVVGGITKIASYIARLHGPFIYQTTNDTGSVYESTCKDLSLRYWWVDRSHAKKYYTRNYCQKHLLKQNFGHDLLENDTETSYMERLGYIKVYDSGLSTINII